MATRNGPRKRRTPRIDLPPTVALQRLYSQQAKKRKVVTPEKRPLIQKDETYLFDMKKMYLSASFSDVRFHCPDGTILHAHKLILSQVSSYFQNAFEGHWKSENPDGIWETSNSADSMKAILSHMYGFPFNEDDIKANPIDVLNLAHEYDLARFVYSIEEYLLEKLNRDNVKEILYCSERLDLLELKEKCFDFVRSEGFDLIMDENFLQISTENKALWIELRSFLKDGVF